MATEGAELAADSPDTPPGRWMMRSGADLVYGAEQLYLRLFTFALVLTVIGSLVSTWFGALPSSRASRPLAGIFCALGLAAAAAGLARRRQAYCWLRYSPQRQGVPAVFAVVALLANGPDSPSWWLALPLLWIVAVVSSTRLAVGAAVVTALAYLAGTVIGGEALLRHGDTGVFPAALALIADTLVARLVVEIFARFLLRMHHLERTAAVPPVRVPNLASASPSATQWLGQPAATDNRNPDQISRLTARQLEVAMLVRDGLRQSEIALCLGVSPRQVERHLHQARLRVGAATTSELVVMLVTGGLAPVT